MPLYMMAYYLDDLWRFPGWVEPSRSAQTPTAADEGGTPGADREIACLQQDYAVASDVHGTVIFDGRHPWWKEFCETELKFAVPDWEAESAGVSRALAEAKVSVGRETPTEKGNPATSHGRT